MMSPLSVAQYLPADAEPFDLVIFDEASQIPTWDAIGVIGRGRQVIVVGDPKQLPPTHFFERHIPGQELEGDAAEVVVQDLESILDECLGAGVPSIELIWHYRSRHESLIAFSNHMYYGGRLVTFPSPVTRDDAVSFRHVANAVYARAGARTNPLEARAVVAEVASRLRQCIDSGVSHTIGIVTFNAEQQTLIQNLLDEAQRDDPSLEAFFAEDRMEPVRVWNLEGVQGEERDLMLFSLTYGPDQAGRVAMNFGPLNQSGGERRLNVAVTRAREELVVFGSLRPEQIDLSRTSAVGVAHLKQFMQFAMRGARAFATFATAPLGDHESPFESAVAERLRALGWVVHSQIGASNFRIDLAVVDPEEQGSYLAGIECDGATYHRGATARDRDRLRQAVLEQLGWKILRIWSTDWWPNAGRETERVHVALKALLAAAQAGRVTEPADESELAPEPVPELPAEDPVQPDPAHFYDDEYKPNLSAIIRDELYRSGPLRHDRLIQRIARVHGFHRSGREIQERVIAAIPAACTKSVDSAGTFIWPVGSVPTDWDRFRMPAPGEHRDPAEIPMEELVVLAKTCVVKHHSEDAALFAMRDACGLRLLRDAARERCRLAIAAAQQSEVL